MFLCNYLTIGGKAIESRLFIGSGKYSSNELIPRIVERSGAQVVTVAVRRVDMESKDENLLRFVPENCILMPNTSGARNAEEAVRIARLAKAMGCGNWIKIEVILDTKYLLPDNHETLKATETLSNEGFTVLPYMSPDLMAAKRLRDAGAAAIMPLGAPIGTNQGLKTKELTKIMIDEISLPIVVDAGFWKPSDACEAMEIGSAAVLINTAIATADDPILMSQAFAQGVKAGRSAYLAGLGTVSEYARSSSPLTGFLDKLILKSFFTSISVEIYPLETDEYRQLINSGADGLTIYQETYDEDIYRRVHPPGPKRDYHYRLDTPERGCRAGMRSIGIGALPGLSEWRREAFYTGLHAEYLQSRYPDTEFSISLPRIRPNTGKFIPLFPVNDRALVQIMLAMRLYLPYAGITVSTREGPVLRDNLVGLGVTRMSAGSSTEVGGYSGEGISSGQFKVSDCKSVDEVSSMLRSKGYQPVFKDWQHI